MALISRSVPGLFGGVSQRIPAMRHPTQCEEQLNGISTVNDGLFKRPGLTHVKSLDLVGANGASVQNSFGNAFAHTIEREALGSFELIIVAGNLMVYNRATGATQSVSFPDGRSYLQTPDASKSFRCVSIADYTFIVNTGVIPSMLTATDFANPSNVAYINVKTAVPGVTYTVTILGVGSATVTTLTSPVPTNESIRDLLKTQLTTVFGGLGYTVSHIPNTNIIKMVKGAGTIPLMTVSDGWGNTAMQVISNGVYKYSDLPPVFESGYTVTILGSADSVQDAYFVKWDGTKWVETKEPLVVDTFNPASMPHKLVYDQTTGFWTFSMITEWGKRNIGNDNTNPLPSFIGNPIRDVFFFRNRLGFLSADNVSISRSGKYFNFFSTTATQVLDTDPIDLSATAGDVETLDCAVVYNQSLLIWSNKTQQFVLAAGDILSPNSARLVPSTKFDAYVGASPKTIGNQVVFATNKGDYCQLSRYKVSQDTVTNSADCITDHVPRYLAASPRKLITSTSSQVIAVLPTGPTKGLKLFKYEIDDNEQLTQRAWKEITIDTTSTVQIINGSWSSHRLYLTLHVSSSLDSQLGGRFELVYLNFQLDANDAGVGYQLCLDFKMVSPPVTYDGTLSTFTLPRIFTEPVTVLACVAGNAPKFLPVLIQERTGESSTTITVRGDTAGSTIWAGIPYKFRYTFTEVGLRDPDGVPIISAELKLVRMLVAYDDSGWFSSSVTNTGRMVPRSYPFSSFVAGVNGNGAGQLGLYSGVANIPVDCKAAGTKVTLESNSYFPCRFPYAEWVGDVNMKARR